MSDNETDLFATGGGSGPSAKFSEKNKWVSGTILKVDKIQEHDFATKEPLVWKDGSPKMQPVVTLQTDERDPANDEDDGIRSLYCKWQIQKAIDLAIRESGHQGRMVGAKLAVCWSGDEDTGKGFPLKLYSARFVPPAETDAFVGEPPDEAPFS